MTTRTPTKTNPEVTIRIKVEILAADQYEGTAEGAVYITEQDLPFIESASISGELKGLLKQLLSSARAEYVRNN